MPPTIDIEVPLAPPRKRRPAGLWIIIAICVGGCVCPLLAGTLLFPVFAQAKEAAQATVCRQNLQEVGDSVLAYEKKFGRFPFDLDDVSYSGHKQVPHDTIKCPKIAKLGFGRGYAYDAANYNGRKLSDIREEDRKRLPLLIEIEDPDTNEVAMDCTYSTRHLLGKWVNVYFIGEGAVRVQLTEGQIGAPAYDVQESLFAQRKQARREAP